MIHSHIYTAKTNLSDFYKNEMEIPEEIYEWVDKAHNEIAASFEKVELMAEYHQARLLKFMNKCQISPRHFVPSTGYGYGDEGRDMLDRLFAHVFGGQDALVRAQWSSATHALSDCLFALLRPGNAMLTLTGKPYDTLEKTIGIGEKDVSGSLKQWGLQYYQLDLTAEGKIDQQGALAFLNMNDVKLVFIQRSRGYSWRPSIPVTEIEQAIVFVKSKRPDIMVLVDNCYGEFTEIMEPSHVGADLTVGSLIKNPGGGLAPTGAYAVGTPQAIEQVACELTSPGLGREVGSYASSYAPFYQGLFLAPHVVAQAIKGSMLTARVFESLGYDVLPHWDEQRSDIIQSIRFDNAEELITFCQAIQSASPVDGHVKPMPWDMPGYSHKVIMAAGTFIQGASIELSADAPLKEPYIAYMQGGLTYAHVKIALIRVLDYLSKRGLLPRLN